MIKLAYGRVFRDALDGEHGLSREMLGELSARFGSVQAEVRRRELGFASSARISRSSRAILPLA